MTAILTDTTVRAWLQRVHGRWCDEIIGVIDCARANDAGIWVRWGAVRYLNTTFALRLDRERHALEAVQPRLLEALTSNPWAISELLDHLRRELDQSVALHQGGEEFSRVAVKFLRALGCWCRETERALSHIHWNTVSEDVREKFALISDDAPPLDA